jgi:hypothetical protein
MIVLRLIFVLALLLGAGCTAKPDRYKVAQFEQIQRYMTRDQVAAVMGGPGTITTQTKSDGLATTTEEWSNGPGRGRITVTYTGVSVDHVTQSGLE